MSMAYNLQQMIDGHRQRKRKTKKVVLLTEIVSWTESKIFPAGLAGTRVNLEGKEMIQAIDPYNGNIIYFDGYEDHWGSTS